MIVVQLDFPWHTPFTSFETLDEELGAYSALFLWGYDSVFPASELVILDSLFEGTKNPEQDYRLTLRPVIPVKDAEPVYLYFRSPDFLLGVSRAASLLGYRPDQLVQEPIDQTSWTPISIPSVPVSTPTTLENDPREWQIPGPDPTLLYSYAIDFPDRRLELDLTSSQSVGLVLGLADAWAPNIELYQAKLLIEIDSLALNYRYHHTQPPGRYRVFSSPREYWLDSMDHLRGYLTGLRAIQSPIETFLVIEETATGERLSPQTIESLIPGLQPVTIDLTPVHDLEAIRDRTGV